MSSASIYTDCMSASPEIFAFAVFQPEVTDQAACKVNGKAILSVASFVALRI